MARRVPGTRPGSAPAPPPELALRGPGTFAFTRGEAKGTGAGRGGAPSERRAKSRRTWAGRLCPRPPGGAAWGDRGRSTRVREGAAPPGSHPPWGAPGGSACLNPPYPNARAGATRSRPTFAALAWSTLWAPGPFPGGSGLISRVVTPSSLPPVQRSPPCSCCSLWPFPSVPYAFCVLAPTGHVSFALFPISLPYEPASQRQPSGLRRRGWRST